MAKALRPHRYKDKIQLPAPHRSATALTDKVELCVAVHQIAHEEVEHVYTSSVHASVVKVAEKALSGAFQTRRDSTTEGLKTAPF